MPVSTSRTSAKEFNSLTPAQRIDRYVDSSRALPEHPAFRPTSSASHKASHGAVKDHQPYASTSQIEPEPSPEPDYAARAERVRQAIAARQRRVSLVSRIKRGHSLAYREPRTRSRSFSIDGLKDGLRLSRFSSVDETRSSQSTLSRAAVQSTDAMSFKRSASVRRKPVPTHSTPEMNSTSKEVRSDGRRRTVLEPLSTNTNLPTGRSVVVQAKQKVEALSRKVKRAFEIFKE